MSSNSRAKRTTSFKGSYNETPTRPRASRTNNVLETDQGYKEHKDTSIEEEQLSDNDTYAQAHKQKTKKSKTHIIEEPGQDKAFAESHDHLSEDEYQSERIHK